MAPLRHASFRLLIAGEVVSNFGDGIYVVAMPWYVLTHRGGVLLLGAVLAAYGIPRTALLVVGGWASDRHRPWNVMMVANCARGLAVAAFAISAEAGAAHGAVLVVLSIALGAGEGIFVPASETVVPALLPSSELQAGNALVAGTTQLSQIAGPACGGVLVALAGPASGFAIDAATFGLSALALAGIRRAATGPSRQGVAASEERASATGVTLRGLFASQPILTLLLVSDALVNLGSAGMSRVALPVLATGRLHAGVGGYGALNAAMAAGLLLGTIAAARLPPSRRPFLLASLALLPTAPLIAALPWAGGLIPTALALTAGFVFIAIGNLLLVTGLQQWAPPAALGRLTGLLLLASVGMMPLSVLVAGAVVRVTGAATYFVLDGACVALAVAAQLSSPAWRRFDPRDRAAATPVSA
ncbi:MAG: MFS transporter [Acidobacteriota bacterium]|nr:MFS transporter [Acidobacteriota bacterium]